MTGLEPEAAWREPFPLDEEHPGSTRAPASSAVLASKAVDEDKRTQRYGDDKLAMVFKKREMMCTRDQKLTKTLVYSWQAPGPAPSCKSAGPRFVC